MFLSFVPRRTGTGGRVHALGIFKRGSQYLRTLFMYGARAASRMNYCVRRGCRTCLSTGPRVSSA